MSKKVRWWLFILYLALFGSYCGLEIDTFVADTPFFRLDTLLLFINVLWIMLVPPILCRSLRPSARYGKTGLRETLFCF